MLEHSRTYVLHVPLLIGMVAPRPERCGQLSVQHPRNDPAADHLYPLLRRAVFPPRVERH